MKKNYLLIFTLLLFFVGCGDDAKVRVVADLEKADVIVNGKKKAQIRIGYASLKLPSGKHEIVVQKNTPDGEWIFSSKQSVDIVEDKINYVEFGTIEPQESQKRKDRIALEIKQREEAQALEIKQLWESTDTVVDEKFGVIWQNIIPKYRLKKPEAEQYCNNLGFAGQKGWRLPTIAESLSINNQDKLKYKKYRLTSESVRRGNTLYYQGIDKNKIEVHFQNSDALFLCVKDQANKEENKLAIAKKFGFKSYPQNIFLDEKNKLLWENDSNVGTLLSPRKALQYCQRLNKNGIKKWRLPTKNELIYLHKKRPKYASLTEHNFYSSTKATTNWNYVVSPWGEAFKAASMLSYYVRCVKDFKSPTDIKNFYEPKKTSSNSIKSTTSSSISFPLTLQETANWKAKIKLDCLVKDEKCGSVFFEKFKCGGDLIFKTMSNSIYTFNESLSYGNCKKGCKLAINIKDLSYTEYCNGRKTGSGMLK